MFSSTYIGETNWITLQVSDKLGVDNLILDNRHIHNEMKQTICTDELFREYLQVLIDLAWPQSAVLQICCDQPAGKDSAIEQCVKNFLITSFVVIRILLML